MIAILKYIQQNFRTASLKELADSFHYEASYLGKYIKAAGFNNQVHFFREFKASVGETPGAYRRREK